MIVLIVCRWGLGSRNGDGFRGFVCFSDCDIGSIGENILIWGEWFDGIILRDLSSIMIEPICNRIDSTGYDKT